MNDGPSAEFSVATKDFGIRQPETSPAIKSLPQATGSFYNSLIDIYLSDDNNDGKQIKVNGLIELLPRPARSLYKKGLHVLQDGLTQNHALLEQHKGKEIQALLRNAMKSRVQTQEEIDELVSQITPDKASFIEPTQGVAIIQLERDLFSNLTEKMKMSLTPLGFYHDPGTNEEPSFIVTRKQPKPLAQDGTTRHEFHHLIWDLLGNGKFRREPKEKSPELSKAFQHFRDEIAGRLVDPEGSRFQVTQIYPLVYTNDKDILNRAYNAKVFIAVCMGIAQSKGADSSSFLFPTMISRNFAELERNFLKLTPVDKELNEETVNTMLNIWSQGEWDFSTEQRLRIFQRILQEKHVNISLEAMRKMLLKTLTDQQSKGYTLENLKNTAERWGKFSSAIGIEELSSSDLLTEALTGKLPTSQ